MAFGSTVCIVIWSKWKMMNLVQLCGKRALRWPVSSKCWTNDGESPSETNIDGWGALSCLPSKHFYRFEIINTFRYGICPANVIDMLQDFWIIVFGVGGQFFYHAHSWWLLRAPFWFTTNQYRSFCLFFQFRFVGIYSPRPNLFTFCIQHRPTMTLNGGHCCSEKQHERPINRRHEKKPLKLCSILSTCCVIDVFSRSAVANRLMPMAITSRKTKCAAQK